MSGDHNSLLQARRAIFRCVPSLRAMGLATLLPVAAAAQSLVHIGTLGGSESFAYSINDSGQVAGYTLLAGDTETRAFLYTGGAMQNLGTLGGTQSTGLAVNATGQVAGFSTQPDDAYLTATLFSGGTVQDLGTLGGTFSQGYGRSAERRVGPECRSRWSPYH